MRRQRRRRRRRLGVTEPVLRGVADRGGHGLAVNLYPHLVEVRGGVRGRDGVKVRVRGRVRGRVRVRVRARARVRVS